MPTKYDVFAEIIEHAPCKAKDLPFKSRIHYQVNILVKEEWVKKEAGVLTPVKNKQTTHAFSIIKYCLKSGLDYNQFFSKNIMTILEALVKNTPSLRPPELRNNQDIANTLAYLEKHQFILLTKKRPRTGAVLQHQLFKNIAGINKKSITFPKLKEEDISRQVLKIKNEQPNPFDNKVFSFLTGSAQLEGSTITKGETIELLLKDIYPNKPPKDAQMVKNLHIALQYVLEHLEENITPEHIKKVNELVLFSLHQGAGKYKKVQNKIQENPSFKTARPEEVSLLIEKYCAFIQGISSKECLQRIGYMHNELQYIHPFPDGNSRTTRMILNWVLLKHKLPLLVLKMGAFDAYMILTKLSKKRDDKRLTNLLNRTLLHEELMN